MPDPIVQAALIGSGADILSTAFGGDSISRAKRMAREEYKYQHRYGPWVQDAMIKGRVQAVKEAGLHPLFALGGGGGSMSAGVPFTGGGEAGSSKSAAVRSIGSRLENAMIRANDKKLEKELAEAQAELATARALEGVLSNDHAWAIDNEVNRGMQLTAQNRASQRKSRSPNLEFPKMQEVKKGEVDAHVPGAPEQSLNRKAPWTKINWGSQKIWILTDQLDTLADNPGFVLGSAYLYHGNKGVNWRKAWDEFHLGPGAYVPSEAPPGTARSGASAISGRPKTLYEKRRKYRGQRK